MATAKKAKRKHISEHNLALFDRLAATVNADIRPYQRRICAQVLDYIDNDIKSIMLESPTGSGKTYLGLMISKMLHEKYGWNTGWVCMNRTLLEQAAAENIGRKINVPNIKFISMFEKNPPGNIDVLLHDEAQHDAASNAVRLHNILQPKIILGMTATPYRTDSMKLCFEKVVKDIGIAQLIKQGYLSPYNHFAIPNWNRTTVINTFLDGGFERWGKSFIFFLTTEQCEEAFHLLKKRGGSKYAKLCEVVTAKTDRARQLEDFHNGDLQLLIGMKTIAEGVNAPDLKTVFIRDSQRGPTIQMAGRVFRIHQDIPVKQVVQSEMTRYPITKAAMPIEQWLLKDGEWRSLKVNPMISKIAMNTTMLMASMVSAKPNSYLARHSGKRHKWTPDK